MLSSSSRSTSVLLRMRARLSASTVRPLHLSPSLGVTDIEFYREIDQSHLHLKEAQGTMRKFLLRLKEREAAEERKRQDSVQRATPHAAVADPGDMSGKNEPLVIPNYVERGPSEVLRAIAKDIGTDHTAPDYRFHDDPFLTPYNSVKKRDFIMSKEGGRRAARYILDNHAELFEKNLVEMDPPIKAFMPKVVFSEKKATEELLGAYLAGYNVEDAIKVYRCLEKQGKEVSQDAMLSLLQLVCFYNEEEAIDEDFNVTAGVAQRDVSKWKDGGLAEELYSKAAGTEAAPAARSAMLCGMARHGQFVKGWQMYLECKANGDRLDVSATNAAVRCLPQKDGLANGWKDLELIFREMKERGVAPNQGTLIATLKWLRAFGNRDHAQACELALAAVAEFRAAGVRMGLGSYKCLTQVFCQRGKGGRMAHDVLEEVDGIDWSEESGLTDEEDSLFFPEMMSLAIKTDSLRLAQKTHEFLNLGGNSNFLVDYGDRFNYYRRYLTLLLKRQSIDVFMESYETYVPHTFSPTTEFTMSVLSEVCKQGRYDHMVRLWTDMQASNFSSANKYIRTEKSKAFLEAVLEVDAFSESSSYAHLKDAFCKMARDVVDDVVDFPDARKVGIGGNNHAAAALDAAVRISLRGEEWRTAADAVDFCARETARLPGALREDSLAEFVSEAVKRDESEAALAAVECAGEQGMEVGAALAEKVADAWELDDTWRKKLNSLFSHDAKWTMLN